MDENSRTAASPPPKPKIRLIHKTSTETLDDMEESSTMMVDQTQESPAMPQNDAGSENKSSSPTSTLLPAVAKLKIKLIVKQPEPHTFRDRLQAHLHPALKQSLIDYSDVQ